MTANSTKSTWGGGVGEVGKHSGALASISMYPICRSPSFPDLAGLGEIRECFNVYCQEGQIKSAAQLRCVLRSLGHSSTAAKTQQYFKNSKKPIDFATFLGIVKEEEESGDALTEVIKALKGLDRSGTRAIPATELRAILSSVGERMSHQEIDFILEQIAVGGIVPHQKLIQFISSK